ncbi:MAG TPA: carboxypeptidase-like regulatory domain-containing protein [Bryobacteraceae bacterium]|nr:carboxypeptidase-like regulatory domain-containing protein [Bryobacteraceae bacterium]
MKKRILSCGALLFFIAAGLSGQNIRGTILGTVRDSSGAVVSGAKVTVRQPATGFTRDQNTNGVGEFLFTELPVGTFNVTAERAGFQSETQQNLVLDVDQRLRVDFTLTVGEVTQTATVEATTPVISTDSATVGNVIESQQVTGLPLNGRNPLELVTLVPGVNNGVKGSQN